MSGKPTPGPIGRRGSFLWQLDDGSLAGRPINLWSGLLSPNNCYSSKYAEDAARLFVASPLLVEALQACLSRAVGLDPFTEQQARAALAAATGESNE